MASTLNGTGVTFSDASTQSVGTSGNFKFNSGYGSEAVAYGCRAWVNFNGTGGVGYQTIRGQGNVSGVYKNSNGVYTVSFASAMPDANYAIHTTGYVSGAQLSSFSSSQSTTSAVVNAFNSYVGTAYDMLIFSVTVFR